MNRIITILVTIFILLLLYIWISHVWGGDDARHPRQIVDAKDSPLSDDLMADLDTSYLASDSNNVAEEPVNTDEFATERTIEAKEKAEAEAKAKESVKVEPAKSEPAAEKKTLSTKVTETKTEPAPKKVTSTPAITSKPASTPAKTESKPAASLSSTDGQHLVIAGNFTQKVNAEQRVQELKKAGFPDAELVNFDLSEYHTVCVGRFSDVNEARRLVKKLKDYHKIDAYVRIGS